MFWCETLKIEYDETVESACLPVPRESAEPIIQSTRWLIVARAPRGRGASVAAGPPAALELEVARELVWHVPHQLVIRVVELGI